LSGDGLSYTFNLRRGVRWADGKPFNADDVMFTFGVLQSPDYQQSTTQYWKDITVEKLGDLQVRFTLKAPSASFPLALRQGILPKHLFGGLRVDAIPASSHSGAKALGTGPFVVGSISPDRHVVRLDRNPYARPQPDLARRPAGQVHAQGAQRLVPAGAAPGHPAQAPVRRAQGRRHPGVLAQRREGARHRAVRGRLDLAGPARGQARPQPLRPAPALS